MGFYDRKLSRQVEAPQQPRLPSPAITPQAHTQSEYYPQEVPVKTRMAWQAQDETGHCPSCGSGNYVGPSSRYEGFDGSSVTTDTGIVRASARCFDCGYNPKMGTILTGYGTTGSTGESTNTRQTANGGMITHNFHKQEIVGRVG